jgi:hypothetical protein
MSSQPIEHASPRVLQKSLRTGGGYSYSVEAVGDNAGLQKADSSPWTNNIQSEGSFTLLPSDNPKHVHTRPYELKYFIRRPRLLQHNKDGEIVNSHGHRIQSASGVELGLLQSSCTVNIEPLGEIEARKQLGEENSVHLGRRSLVYAYPWES